MVDALTLLQNVCSLGPYNVGFIQKPLFHAATSMGALVKHQRKMEDMLLKSDLDFSQSLTLMFSKDSARQGSDKRPQTQGCMVPWASKANKWQDSEAIQSGILGPLQLVSVMEMQGYDPESRPGPAARVEQTLG